MPPNLCQNNEIAYFLGTMGCNKEEELKIKKNIHFVDLILKVSFNPDSLFQASVLIQSMKLHH